MDERQVQPERRRSGFSLTELLIVVTILVAATAIALPRIDHASMKLDGNMRTVQATLQQAWRRASEQQHDVIVGFDVATGRIRIADDQNNDRTISGAERVTWRALAEQGQYGAPGNGVNGTVSAPVTGPGVVTVNGMPSVIVHRNGSISGDAEIYVRLLSPKGTHYRAILWQHGTGRTEVYRYVAGAWKGAKL